MNNKFLLCAITVSSIIVAAHAFEPAFKLVQPEGKIKIKTAGVKRAETPKINQAYAYGSTLTLAKGSSVNVILGDGSSFKIIGEATVVMNEKGKEKIIDLKKGKVEFNLAKGFDAKNDKLTVKSGNNEITPASAGTFSVDSKQSYSFDSSTLIAETAKISIKGAQYDVESFGPKSELSVTADSDGSFSKILVAKGNMNLAFDTDDGAKELKVEKGETVNIWRQVGRLGSTITSTVMITGPDSTVKTQFSFSKKLETPVHLELASTTTTTTTTTTTSTTTLISPTPIGDR
jgi:hypothetical protein